MSVRWEPTAENVPWRKVIVRLEADAIDELLGFREGLVLSAMQSVDMMRQIDVKFYGPDLPEKYTTKEGGKIQTIDWAQFKREVLEKGA